MHTATVLDRHRLPAGAAPGQQVLARLGRLEVRLAQNAHERGAAFRLRHEVFVAEQGARPPHRDDLGRIEREPLDEHAQHLLVWDGGDLVGTARVRLPQADLLSGGAADLFELAPLFARHPTLRFGEVGRACVASSHRGGHVLDVLLAGLWAFGCDHDIAVLYGLASLSGADPAAHAMALARIAASSPPGALWDVAPRPVHAAQAGHPGPPDGAQIKGGGRLRALLPPLIRGYVHLGGRFASRVAIDRRFGTTDLLVTVQLAAMPQRFRAHFARLSGRIL